MRRAVLLGVVALALTACGGAETQDAPGLSTAPTVPVLDVVVTGEVATLLANVVAPDGDLTTVVVEWGDGTSDTVTSGFPGVRLDHTYTDDGDFTIVLEAHDAAGRSVIATTVASVTAFAAAADASPDDSEGESGGSNGSGGAGGGSTEPTPTPSPGPDPEEPSPEPEEPSPEPVPEPVTLDLLDSDVVIDLVRSSPDGVGGSAETVQQGQYSFGVRSYAWHGVNGSGNAKGTLGRTVDATAVLAGMPAQVTAVTAEVFYEVDVRAEVKGPFDRFGRITVATGFHPSIGHTRRVARLTVDNDHTNPVQQLGGLGSTGMLTTTLTRDQPATTFQLTGECISRSGSELTAWFNEGYCDALDKGGITLRALTVTYTPVVED